MRDKIAEILNLIKIKKFKEAQIKCDDIKKHFDENVEFLHIYGFVFFNLKNYEKAIVQWEKAIKINPNFVDGLNNLCLLYTSPSPRDLYRSRMPSSA